MEVIVVSWDSEWTIWSVAPVSIIQESDLNTVLSTIWAENTKWEKLGGIQKGLPEKLEEIEAELKEEGKDDDDVCGKAEMDLGVMTEAIWLVWVPKPKPEPEYPLRKESNYSHWAGEMGHRGW